MILETDKEKLEVSGDERKKKNTSAYNDLLLAMTDNASFCLVDKANSTDYPEEYTRVAWGKLMQRFESLTNASMVKLMGKFSCSILKKKTQDCYTWISELDLMMIRLKKVETPIDDEFLMMQIMNNLLSSYDSLIKNLEDRLDSIVD